MVVLHLCMCSPSLSLANYRRRSFIQLLYFIIDMQNQYLYTRGQVSVNKRNSVLSNYFDVSFEIYYVRLKYIDSIGQVVKLLILTAIFRNKTHTHTRLKLEYVSLKCSWSGAYESVSGVQHLYSRTYLNLTFLESHSSVTQLSSADY